MKPNQGTPLLRLDFPDGWRYSQQKELYVNEKEGLESEGPVFKLEDLHRVLAFEGIEHDWPFMRGQLQRLRGQAKGEGEERKKQLIARFRVETSHAEFKTEDPISVLS